jgi:cellulose synthase/poly-beta-1,6-N-acetylglucosamine synthase-like glycosyltransferase
MSSSSQPRYSVILPTYNERENLPLIVSMLDSVFRLHALDWEVVIVDDNSPDGTGDVAERLQRVLGSRVVLLRRAGTGDSAAATAAVACAAADDDGPSFLLLCSQSSSLPSSSQRTAAAGSREAQPTAAEAVQLRWLLLCSPTHYLRSCVLMS